MTSKIEIYREVLALEPASRVFFPLAKMLVEQGETPEAMDVLRRGVGHHPDFLEAKFLLVELLCGQNRRDEALGVFEGVSALFAKYPSVLAMWAEKGTGLSEDASLALRFLTLALRDGQVSLAGVLDRGLDSYAQRGESVGAESAPAAAEAPVPAATPEGPAFSGGFSLRGADEVMALAQRIEALEKRAPREELPPDCASQASAQVKTRTMAELLAKHGDYDSALEIFEELLPLASPGHDRDQLAARIEEIKSEAQSGKPVPKASEGEKPRAKLVSMLEALANRLDARASA